MNALNKNEIKNILPHREPMLLIDYVLNLERGKRVVAIKKVTNEDIFLKGHFPGKPIMPGTSIVEAMAQASILLYHSEYEDKIGDITPEYYLGSVKAHFLHGVFPGDELRIEAETIRLLPSGGMATVKAYVKDKQVAEAELVFITKQT